MDLKKFANYLSLLCARPAMYVGRADTNLVWTYLSGYSHGVNNAQNHWGLIGGWTIWDDFDTWLRCKFLINHPAWSMSRILWHQHNHNHQEAILAIPKYFEEFLVSDRLSQDLWEQFQKKLKEKYGTDDLLAAKAPDCNTCAPNERNNDNSAY